MKSLQYVPEVKSLDCEPCSIPRSDSYPTMYVDSKQMPEIDEWEVGKEYTVKVVLKMKSYSIREGSDRSNAEFCIESYAGKTEKSLN